MLLKCKIIHADYKMTFYFLTKLSQILNYKINSTKKSCVHNSKSITYFNSNNITKYKLHKHYSLYKVFREDIPTIAIEGNSPLGQKRFFAVLPIN